jgi:hypothetical protein
MSQTDNNKEQILPEYMNLLIGKNSFNISTENVISSMVQQVIHKNNMLYNADDYAMVFDVTKIEVVNFLESIQKDDLDDLDLLGDWIETFDTFQVNKNQSYCKDLIIEFSDNTKFIVKFLDLLSLKNQINDEDSEYINPKDELLADEEKFIEYFTENFSWEQISPYAELLKDDTDEEKYIDEWKTSKKSVSPWEKNLSIFDFIAHTDIMVDEDEEDDQPLPDH